MKLSVMALAFAGLILAQVEDEMHPAIQIPLGLPIGRARRKQEG